MPLAIDVSNYTTGFSAAALRAVTLAGERGYEVGIYSAKWWWDRFQHGVTAFSMLPLWAAQYDGERDTAIVPFGGWERAEMKQYAGIGEIAGVGGIDFNWYQEGVEVSIGAAIGIGVAEDDMQTRALSDDQKARLGAFLEPLVRSHFTDLVDTDPTDGFDIGIADTPTHDVVVLRLPKGTVTA